MSDALLMLVISTVIGIVQAIFWRWVSTLSDARKEDGKKIEYLQNQVTALKVEIYRDYQSKSDAHRDNEQIMEMLRGLKADLEKLSDKLDKKADKS